MLCIYFHAQKTIITIFTLLILISSVLLAQTTEKFSDNNDGDKIFSEGGLTFSVTGNLEVDYRAGWGLDDDYFISNYANPVSGGGTVGSFTNAGSNFNVYELYIIPLNASELIEHYNNIQIIGKLDGGTQFTHTIPWDSFNKNPSPNNYFTYVDLSSYSSYTLDQLQFVIEPYGTNDIVYLMIDDFQFIADASLPVELGSFTAANRNNTVELEWDTASETDNLGFTIERKTETSTWRQIASYSTHNILEGQGTTSSPSQYGYTDASIIAGESYTYRLSDVSTNGNVNIIGITSVETTPVPTSTQLFAAFPNPFNPATTLQYQLAKDGHVSIIIYDMLGREIKTLVDTQSSAGEYSVIWNGTMHDNSFAPSGTYLVSMKAGNTTQTHKIMLLK